MKIYIASSEKHVGKIQEDFYIRDAYRGKGLPCEITTMEKIIKLSKPFDVVVLKSIWGYHLHYQKFLKQILILKKRNVQLVNSYDFIFWNIDKHQYLYELRNMHTVPSVLLNLKSAKKGADVRDIILQAHQTLNANTLVIKPCISASGYLTLQHHKTKDNKEVIDLLRKNKKLDFIAQPYRPDILDGELSVIMVDGVPMYGVKRFPGVFTKKKNLEYLGKRKIPKKVLEQVKILNNFFVDRFESLPKICRIDFVKNGLDYELMEVELIDPDLFFRYIPEKMLCKCLEELINT